MEQKLNLTRSKKLGFIDVPDGLLDITDPCYSKGVWCRMNDVKVVPGRYACFVWRGEDEWGKRVWINQIILADHNGRCKPYSWAQMKEIGTIGVDAGLAGFFNHKPDFNDEEWRALCDKMFAHCRDYYFDEPDEQGNHHGFWSESGYGDGGYPVYAQKNNQGDIFALEIRF